MNQRGKNQTAAWWYFLNKFHVKPPSLEQKTRKISLTQLAVDDPKLVQFESLLKTEGITRGLLGPKEADRIRERHILNCLPLSTFFEPESKLKVADLGSGAGLPGVVVAIANPTLDLTLIEPLARRAQFLSEVISALGLDIKIEAKNSKLVTKKFDVVMARAVAPIDKLLELARPLLNPNGRVLALVGQNIHSQFSASSSNIFGKFDLTLHQLELGEASVLVIEAKLKRGDAA